MYDRLVYLGGWSEAGPERGRTPLTPNGNAARTLGVEPLSLDTLGRQVLGDERIAHPLTSGRLLRGAVVEALGTSDPDGVARTLLPPIRELFRAGADAIATVEQKANDLLAQADAYCELSSNLAHDDA